MSSYDNSKITFNEIPSILGAILDKLEMLESKIDDMQTRNQTTEDCWFDVDGLAAYLPSKPAKQTIYGWTSTNAIPYHKAGKSNIFRKSEIDDWIVKREVQSTALLARSANDYVHEKRSKKIAPWLRG